MEGPREASNASITLFLAGDVMTGRGVDQILRHPGDPRIPEAYIRDARAYVHLAEEAHGRVPRGVDPAYPWGEALEVLRETAPQARLANLETAITTCDEAWPEKGVHYRMHPANVECLQTAGLDVVLLANNHAMDYGRAGLEETLATLRRAGLRPAGAGADLSEALASVSVPLPGGASLRIFALACASSGVPAGWAAEPHRSGVAYLEAPMEAAADALLARVHAAKGPRDLALVSLHWGSNWGYEVPREHVRFARRLVDGGVDLVFGHSSHHPRPMEVHGGRLILYGAGDFIDDYEGIGGHEAFRDDLRLMFLPTLDPATGALLHLRMVPFAARRLRLQRARRSDTAWLAHSLGAACRPFGTQVRIEGLGELSLA